MNDALTASDTTEASGSEDSDLRDLRKLAQLLDARFTIPGTRIGIGLDALFGLLPVVGDAATVVPALYLLVRAARLGARKRTLARMAWNSTIDVTIGAIPLVGDLFDIGYRANLKNVALVERDLARRRAKREREQKSLERTLRRP